MYDVLYVEEVSCLFAVSVDRWCVSLEVCGDEDGDEAAAFGVVVGAVDVAEAEAGVLPPVLACVVAGVVFCGVFAYSVGCFWFGECVFAYGQGVFFSVSGSACGEVDYFSCLGVLESFEDVYCAEDVCVGVFHGVFDTCLDLCLCGCVDEDVWVYVFDDAFGVFKVLDVYLMVGPVESGVVAGCEYVDALYVVALCEEGFGYVGSDEPCSSCDEHGLFVGRFCFHMLLVYVVVFDGFPTGMVTCFQEYFPICLSLHRILR